MRRRHPALARLPARVALASHALSIDLAARVGVQPAAEFRHVQSHRHELHVLCALRELPCPPSPVGCSLARCIRRRHPAPARLTARVAPRRVARGANREPLISRTNKASTSRPLYLTYHFICSLWPVFSPCLAHGHLLLCLSRLPILAHEDPLLSLSQAPIHRHIS